MRDLSALILNAISKKSYQPMSPKALARKLGLEETSYREFRGALRGLVKEGKAQLGKNDRSTGPLTAQSGRHLQATLERRWARPRRNRDRPRAPGVFRPRLPESRRVER